MYHWVENCRKRIIFFLIFFFLHLCRFRLLFRDSSYFLDSQMIRMEGTGTSPSLGAGTARAADCDAKVRALPSEEYFADE